MLNISLEVKLSQEGNACKWYEQFICNICILIRKINPSKPVFYGNWCSMWRPSPKPTLLQHLHVAVTYVQVPYPASDNSASLYAVSLQKMTLVFLSYICTKFACKNSNLLTVRKENRMGYSSGTNPSEIFKWNFHVKFTESTLLVLQFLKLK